MKYDTIAPLIRRTMDEHYLLDPKPYFLTVYFKLNAEEYFKLNVLKVDTKITERCMVGTEGCVEEGFFSNSRK